MCCLILTEVEVGGGMEEPWLLPLFLTAWRSAFDWNESLLSVELPSPVRRDGSSVMVSDRLKRAVRG